MSCYIASQANRVYVALEEEYGKVPLLDEARPVPAVRLVVSQETERPLRRDKTGTRTYWGVPGRMRKLTRFELRSYMTQWEGASGEPCYGALFRAALGGAVRVWPGGTAGEGSQGQHLRFAAPHTLVPGQAVAFGGELRFVAGVDDEYTVNLNAPFGLTPTEGSPLGRTVTYMAGRELPSACIYDYWSPDSALQRIVCGVGVDRMRIVVNSDYHEFHFAGGAMDVLDNQTFEPGEGGLETFPSEPVAAGRATAIIPGHLGQAWIGAIPQQFFTVTGAEISLNNNLDMRVREFGALTPRCIVPGRREVQVDLSLFGRDDEQTLALYQAAKRRSPIQVMFQLGEAPGQLFGVYMKSVVPEVPAFDDREARLEWHFSGCVAEGTLDDEIVVAFG